MKVLSDLLLYLLAAAFIQNFILTTGFGSSIMLRIVRRPKDILLFSGLLAGFSAADGTHRLSLRQAYGHRAARQADPARS